MHDPGLNRTTNVTDDKSWYKLEKSSHYGTVTITDINKTVSDYLVIKFKDLEL